MNIVDFAEERRQEGEANGKPARPELERDLIVEFLEECADAFNYVTWDIERCQDQGHYPHFAMVARECIVDAFHAIMKHRCDKLVALDKQG